MKGPNATSAPAAERGTVGRPRLLSQSLQVAEPVGEAARGAQSSIISIRSTWETCKRCVCPGTRFAPARPSSLINSGTRPTRRGRRKASTTTSSISSVCSAALLRATKSMYASWITGLGSSTCFGRRLLAARLLAPCALPRTNPGNRLLYKRVNGPYRIDSPSILRPFG